MAVGPRVVVLGALALAVAVAVAAGYYLAAGPSAEAGGGARVYYVVPYEWSFAIFDEEWRRVDRIVVDRGERLILVVLPRPFVPSELFESLEAEFAEYAVREGLVSSREELEELMEEVHHEEGIAGEVFGAEFVVHGLAISGYEDEVNVAIDDGLVKVVEFVADEAGAFDIYCSAYCGWGHAYMRLAGGLVVNG